MLQTLAITRFDAACAAPSPRLSICRFKRATLVFFSPACRADDTLRRHTPLLIDASPLSRLLPPRH